MPFQLRALQITAPPNSYNMLFSQTILILGALFTTSTSGLALQARDELSSQLDSNSAAGGGYKFCYAVQVKLTVDQSLKRSAQEKTKIINQAFSVNGLGDNVKSCGTASINAGGNPASGSIIKAFKFKPSPTNFKCFGKDKQGDCGLAADLTLSSRDAGSCGTCGKLA